MLGKFRIPNFEFRIGKPKAGGISNSATSGKDFKPLEFERFKIAAGSCRTRKIGFSSQESINALSVRQGMKQSERLMKLNEIAITQMRSLVANKTIKQLK
jgi:hypothetical protein